MLAVKVVYNKNSNTIPEVMKVAYFNPIYELINEDSAKELKKAYKVKGSGAARETPFIGVYNDGKLIKAFYTEDGSAADNNFFEWLEEYYKENGKKGHMTITKLEGTNNTHYQPGVTHEGNTECFAEGTALYLISPDRWFHTSVIKDIDWNGKIFHTMNSTYKFELNEA